MKDAQSKDNLIIGVDTGGTFTDVVGWYQGSYFTHKLPSTPDNPSEAILEGVKEVVRACELQHPPTRLSKVIHGSTVATNTILERRGANVAFITTEGFSDLIEIGRQNRPVLYELNCQRSKPLVSRKHRYEVAERMVEVGKALKKLPLPELEKIAQKLPKQIEAIAIGFLFSYLNPKHEKQALKVFQRNHKHIPITLASDISPEMREYERFSTAILNAYVAPKMIRYLDHLKKNLQAETLEIMGSNGGTVSFERARVEPVGTFLSGPAAGVLGAMQVGEAVRENQLITFDMGGTSTDVSLVSQSPTYRTISEIDGLAIRYPILDIHTVGAGGGSIVRLDSGQGLRVGPESAGADPGPIVYGKGSEITVTDVHVFLGHLDEHSFLGGKMKVYPERVKAKINSLARKAKLSSFELAQGALKVVNAEMERAIRVVSQQRGHDPRNFSLASFGGASGLHAVALAKSLLIPKVIVPEDPGLLCATGMLRAPRIRWRSQTLQKLLSELDSKELNEVIHRLLHEANKDFPGVKEGELNDHIELELRFEGQTHVMQLEIKESQSPKSIERNFKKKYQQLYGEVDSSWQIEVVTVRVSLSEKKKRSYSRTSKKRVTKKIEADRFQSVQTGEGKFEKVPVYLREDFTVGMKLKGPLIVSEYSGTLLCPKDCRLEVLPKNALLLSFT